MEEFVFSISYDRGVDPYMDVLMEHDSLRSEAVYSSLGADELWTLESLTGDREAIGEAAAALAEHDRESVSERPCGGERRRSVLTDQYRRRVTYSHRADVERCDAVAPIAAQYVEGGLLVTVTRQGDAERWRLLLQDDDTVGMLYDTIAARLRDGLEFEFERLGPAADWTGDPLVGGSLPAEQRETLVLAVERGYFETPRAVTLDELAEELDAPRSTVSYRLRRATAQLATDYVDHTRT